METTLTVQQRLLRTPPPECDESLLGYVLRLTEANHYDNASWVTNLAGINVNFSTGGWLILNRDDTDLTALEAITGLRPGTLESLKYQVAGWKRDVSFQGVSLSADVMNLSCPKVCPACLQETNHCRRVWDLLPYTACSLHEVFLINICPSCHRRLSWARRMVSCCRCGADWRNAPKVRANSLDLKASRRIGELCRTETVRATEQGDNEPLYQLDLSELCEALLLFACYYSILKSGMPLTTETRHTADHEAFSHAFSALEEWPHGFEGFMEKFGLSPAGRYPKVGPIFQLHRRARKGKLDFITITLEEYIENAFAPYEEVLNQTQKLHKRFIPVTELALYSAAGPRHLEWLLHSGRVRVCKKTWNGRDEMLVDLDSVARYKERLALCFTSADAAEHLGISVDEVGELVWYGCLTPVSGPSVDGFSEWRFYGDESERLLEAVDAKVLAETDNERCGRLLGEEVLSLLRRHKISVGRFIRDVLGGNPTPRSKGSVKGLPKFTFGMKEIAEYVFAKTGKKICAKETSNHTLRQLARTLEKMKEQNDNVYQRGAARRDENGDESWVSSSDLVRIAVYALSKAESNIV